MNNLVHRRWRRCSRIAIVALVLLGCDATDSKPPVGRTPPPDPVDSVSVELTVIDTDRLDTLLTELAGKVVLVDFWATWCGPCVEQLPHTISLAQNRADDGLACVTVCMEDPDDLERIREFLDDHAASETLNFVAASGGRPAAMDAFDIAGGALPHYKLYDRSGKLSQTFAVDPRADEQFTIEDIDEAVERLLAQ